MEQRENIGVLGANYWGSKLVRVSNKLGYSVTVVDPQASVRNRIRNEYPDVRILPSPSPVFNDETIPTLFIATPSSTHFALAQEALHHKKHVFVEKP